MDKNIATLLKKLQSELEAYQNLQKVCVKLVKQRSTLETQLSENQCVLGELNILSPDNKVFKLCGPILVKQDPEEARQHIGKRIEYISNEMKQLTDTLEGHEKNLVEVRESVQKLQQQYQVAAAMK